MNFPAVSCNALADLFNNARETVTADMRMGIDEY